MTFGKAIREKMHHAFKVAVCAGVLVSLSSCVPLLIGAAGVTVGYIARDEGFGQAPPLDRENNENAFEEPAAYGDGSGEFENLGDYDVPVY